MAYLPSCLFSALFLFYLVPFVASSGDFSALEAEFGRRNNESLFWGPYKPNLYFGVRPRAPHGLWTGLMWSRADELAGLNTGFRFTCEQHQGIRGYGWEEYDIRTGGHQTIYDEANGIDITTSFVKIPVGGQGGSWAARIKGVPRPDAPADLPTILHFFIAQDGPDAELAVDTTAVGAGEHGFANDLPLQGTSQTLGPYKIVITQGDGLHPSSSHTLSAHRNSEKMVVQSLIIAEESHWRAKEIVFQQLQESLRSVPENNLPPPWLAIGLDNRPGAGNVHIVQRVFEGPFEFDVLFSSVSTGREIDSSDVTRELRDVAEQFANRFSLVFQPQTPYQDEDHIKFGKNMFSNLLGGVGYFHGEHLVDRSQAPEYDESDEDFWTYTAEARARRAQRVEGPHELFTSIPSRTFFPRGFLWDEGFHLLPIVDWDIDLALEVTASWFNLMDDDGWIAREQILGPEARSKVPEEFQVQYPHYANPPTLFFIIDALVERLRTSSESQMEAESDDSIPRTYHVDHPQLGRNFLRKIFPLLQKHRAWFRRTQAGDLKSYDRQAHSLREGYRWRGRSETHILPSGLDDYPRAWPPHPGELHVDLLAWMGLMTRSLAGVADLLDLQEDAIELTAELRAIERNLDDLHWSEQQGCYCDATVDEFEEHVLVCHKGYISLFPFLVGLLPPNHPHLGKILDLVGDEQELFSPYGLRSLSKAHPLFGMEEDYWRGAVWININYLAITQLFTLSTHEGSHQNRANLLYSQLRRNVVDTIFKSWTETGFAWEQYDSDTGRGRRTQHFTGWTSLVVKIMAMEDRSGPPHSAPVKDEL